MPLPLWSSQINPGNQNYDNGYRMYVDILTGENLTFIRSSSRREGDGVDGGIDILASAGITL